MSQKLGIDACLERTVGVLSEEECSTEVMKSLVQNSLSGLCLLLANYLVSSHLTGPWILPKMRVELFAKINPTTEACGCISTLVMGWGLLPL